MKKVIIKAPADQLQAALRVADSFIRFYDHPDKWDKAKIRFASFTAHETQTGSIVVNYIA